MRLGQDTFWRNLASWITKSSCKYRSPEQRYKKRPLDEHPKVRKALDAGKRVGLPAWVVVTDWLAARSPNIGRKYTVIGAGCQVVDSPSVPSGTCIHPPSSKVRLPRKRDTREPRQSSCDSHHSHDAPQILGEHKGVTAGRGTSPPDFICARRHAVVVPDAHITKREVGREGLEPSKAVPADLQSAPFAARDTDPG